MKYSRVITLIFFAIFVSSCDDDRKRKPLDVSDLHGKWNVYDAERNGKPSESLLSSYFVFNQDNSVTSNLLNPEDSIKFEFKKNLIKVEGERPMNLKVRKLQNDSMELVTKLKSWEITFYLLKQDSIGNN